MAAAELKVAIVNEARIFEFLGRLAALMDDIANRLARIDRRQAALERAVNVNTVNDIITREALMADFTALHAEVESNGDAVDSAVTLLNTLSAQLVDAADDPDEIRAIADQLASNSTRLADAVVANTPAAPEPGPVVEPTPVDEPPVG
jgi:energy-converting hydrogenase A subunit M